MTRTRLFLLRILPVILLIIGFAACSGGAKGRSRILRESTTATPPLEAPMEIERAPWELWSYGQDLDGVSIKVEGIREGDAALKAGDYATGLRAYQKVDTATLTPKDQEALITRIASAQMGLGQYKPALDTVSRYFDKLGLGAEAVGGHFALLLAYGYGALSDYDQSFAWFGRADATESNSPIFSNAAQRGARLLIASISESNFDEIYARWKDDQNIGALFVREKALRMNPDYRPALVAGQSGKFWRRDLPQDVLIASKPLVKPENVSVGVILPLSGPFAPLGTGTKNGMDLALEVENETRLNAKFRDSQGDTTNATNLGLDLIKNEKVNVLVGPLLSEEANAVRLVALQTRVPQLSLSKGNVFETGDIIFRLGATSNSQADTLLDACSQMLGMTKFAVVYPENAVGLEYAGAFKKYINAKGLELVYEATYRPDDSTKLTIVAAELERLPVEGIFFPDSLSKAQEFFGLFSEGFHDRVRPLGPATWDDPVQLANSQAIFNRAVFVSPFFAGSTNPPVSRFISLYTQKYGKKPDFLAAQGFDAITLVIGALRKTLEEGTPFELAFKDVEGYNGVTGTMRVDVSGEVQRNYAVVEAHDGELRAVKPMSNTANMTEQSQVQAPLQGSMHE